MGNKSPIVAFLLFPCLICFLTQIQKILFKCSFAES